MIATSGFLTALECTKFVFGRGSALNRDPAFKEEGEGKMGKEEGKGRGREREGPAPLRKFVDPPLLNLSDGS